MAPLLEVLIKDTTKLTLGQPLTILAPHAIESLIRQLPNPGCQMPIEPTISPCFWMSTEYSLGL